METKDRNSPEILRKNSRNSLEIPWKEEILAQIAANPEEALADIETLRTEIAADRLILKGKESLICYFASVAEDYWKRYHEVRLALIRARILVRELKKMGYAQK